MRIPRIYQAIETLTENPIQLDELASRHLVQVLRLRADDPFILFNGMGNAWQAKIHTAEKKRARATILEEMESKSESPLDIHLGLGISKGERMDYAIQKAVELGVRSITPLETRYSMVKLDDRRKEKRHQHWQGVIISACGQCGRNLLPTLHLATDNNSWIKSANAEQKLILDPTAAHTLSEVADNPVSVSLYIGPEGGLSDDEIAYAKQHGFTGVQLGPRILRTETAVVAALTAVQVVWGDLNQ